MRERNKLLACKGRIVYSRIGHSRPSKFIQPKQTRILSSIMWMVHGRVEWSRVDGKIDTLFLSISTFSFFLAFAFLLTTILPVALWLNIFPFSAFYSFGYEFDYHVPVPFPSHLPLGLLTAQCCLLLLSNRLALIKEVLLLVCVEIYIISYKWRFCAHLLRWVHMQLSFFFFLFFFFSQFNLTSVQFH